MLKNKKRKAPSGTRCTSKSNGYTCALTGDHTEHSSKEKRSGQYITWEPVGDGKLKVTFHQGKRATENIEDDPNPPVMATTPPDQNIVELEDGTLYDRKSPLGPPVKLPESWKSPEDRVYALVVDAPGRDALQIGRTHRRYIKALEQAGRIEWRDGGWWPVTQKAAPMTLEDEPEDPEADAAAIAAMEQEIDELDDEKCNAVPLHDDDWVCVKPKGHKGEHQSELVPGGRQATWTTNADGSEDGKIRPIDHKGKVKGVTSVGSGGWALPSNAAADRAAEEPDGEAVTTDPNTPGFSEDPAPKPGDTRTVNGRSERWVWGPVGGWGWRTYKAAGKGCAGCGRHKVDCMCKKMKAAPAGNISSVGAHTEAPQPQAVPVESAPSAREYSDERRILGMRRHPAAALFPLLEGEELAAFVERMRPGQRDPIVRVTVGGETFILDGSNRGVACEILGLTPKFVDYEGSKDMDSLVAYSIDKNGDGRRHLDPSIRAMIVVESVKLLPRGNPGETGRSAGLTQAEAGKKLGVSERLVRRAAVVQSQGSAKLKDAVMKGKLAVDAAEKVARLPKDKQDKIADEALAKKSGQMKAGRVIALAKQEEKRAIVRKINEQRVAPMPAGPFGVIYGDYPWLYENSDQHEGSRGHMGYPPMTLDQILAHAREASKRAAKDCVLALWVTNAHVIDNIGKVIAAYGATHHTMWTWPKPKAGVGTWGRGQTEHLVIASIGNPVHTLNEVSTLLQPYQPERPGEHSSKPQEVAQILTTHCAGPHLELFARDSREGWATWGAEVDKFASEAA